MTDFGGQWPVPAPGTYIAFSIDPVETLEALNDPEVAANTRSISTKQYVGLVLTGSNLFDVYAPYRSFTVELLYPRLPVLSEENGIEPHMCAPVFPTTDHPVSREPLQPTKPLPWSHVYHHSISETAVFRVRTGKRDDTEPVRLMAREKGQRLKYCEEDRRRQADLVKAYRQQHGQLPSEDSQRGVQTGGDPLAQSPDADSQSVASSYDSSELSGSDDDGESRDSSGDLDGLADIFSARDRPSDTMTAVRATYNLSSVEFPGDPDDFFREQNYLIQLEKESKARAIEKARKIDEEAFPSTMPQREMTKKTKTFSRPKKILSGVHRRLSSLVMAIRKFTKLRRFKTPPPSSSR